MDPSGKVFETLWDVASFAMGVVSLKENIAAGNYGWAAVDAVGIAMDAAAIAAPGVPGGVSAILKATRATAEATGAVVASAKTARSTRALKSEKEFQQQYAELQKQSGRAEAAAERAKNTARGIPEAKLGPSGKPKIHVKEHATRKRAEDAAQDRSRRGSAPEEHSNPTTGDPHFHPSGSNDREHHTYPGKGFPKNEEY
jgi:hypothetical protein